MPELYLFGHNESEDNCRTSETHRERDLICGCFINHGPRNANIAPNLCGLSPQPNRIWRLVQDEITFLCSLYHLERVLVILRCLIGSSGVKRQFLAMPKGRFAVFST
jgi:hypothetical protein